MIKNVLFVLLLMGALSGCENKEKESLRKQVDSLNLELERSHAMSFHVRLASRMVL